MGFNLDGWIDTIIFFVTASVFCQYFLLPIPVLCVVCVLGQRMCYKCVSMSMDGRNCVAMSRTDRSPTSSSTHQTPLSTNTLLPKYINALQCLLLVFLDAKYILSMTHISLRQCPLNQFNSPCDITFSLTLVFLFLFFADNTGVHLTQT